MGTSLININPPTPPAFLDPLFSLEDCYYYAVPRFLDINHPTNRWLLGRIKANDADALRRKLEYSPDFFRDKYFQVLDNPSLYFVGKSSGSPMYHSKCVLYLTPLGISIYMKSMEVMQLLLTYRDISNEPLVRPDEVQYASHIQSPCHGDFHAFLPFVIMIRREFFGAAAPLQAAGWNPNTELALPFRRRYERRAFYFRDWLDLALHLLSCKSFYHIHLLIGAMVEAPSYRPSKLPLGLLVPTAKDRPATPVGLVDVGDLPLGLSLTGASTLLEMAQKYDRYLQLQQTMRAVQELKLEAACDGQNPELVVQMAQDSLEPPAGLASENRNNNARSSKRQQQQQQQQQQYCSEPLRVLLFSLEKDKRCKSLQQCIDAFGVYTKQNYFLNAERLHWEEPRARDQRNIVNCLLNMARREQDRIEAILQRARSGKRRFQHVEEHKVLESRRQQHAANIDRLVGCLAQLLLQGKEVVSFLHSSRFPLYPAKLVDFQLEPKVSFIMPSIRFGVIREFNSNRRAWRHLTGDMLRAVAKDSALTLYMRVGKAPSKDEVASYTKKKRKREAKKGGSKK